MSYDERLSRLVRKLSAEHDFQSPHDEAPHLRFSSIPLHWGPELCTFPSLSIVPPPLHHQPPYSYDDHRSQRLQSYEQLDPATKPDQSQHQEYVHLMSRKEKCSQYSIPLASFNMLRNLILSFKSILEHQTQHLIYNVMESKQKAILNPNNKHMEEDQQTLEKLTSLPTNPISSLLIPESAWMDFSTMLPMEQWHEVGYENISLRLVFRAEINIRIVPSDTVYKASLKSKGVTVGIFSNQMNRRPEELDIDINTRALYNSIRQECKVIAKKLINALVGHELLKIKAKNHFVSMQRNPVSLGHNKHLSMHSDGGATNKTDKTAISSVDGQEAHSLIASSSHLEECRRNVKSPIPNDEQSENVYNNLTPKKRTNPTKFEQHSHLKIPSKEAHEFAIIYEQESLDDLGVKKTKKKKDHGWKRLLSPHKTFKAEGVLMNQTTANLKDNDSDEEGVESKSKKKQGWKRVFLSSKQ